MNITLLGNCQTYFLELVREICSKTGWNYYSDEQYNQYLKKGYPFG